jgi:Putative zinc-finger
MAMTCEDYLEAIQELAEGTLDVWRRERLEAHLATCADCAALARELVQVRDAARALPPLTPPERVWAALAPELTPEEPPVAPPAKWREWVLVPLAVAALLLAAVLITWTSRRSPGSDVRPTQQATTAPASKAPAADLGSVEAELQQAEQHYENAIQKLEALARDQRALDPAIAADLRQNLVAIDTAIGESRAALKTQPTNERAQESLFEAFRSKIALLQDTIALINEMRKGNQAEAARIADGLKKS